MALQPETASTAKLPVRTRFYYGWVMVGTLAVFSFVVGGLAGPNVAFFINPMAEDLGMSRQVFGWSQSAKLLFVIVTGTVIGRMIDRRGPRVPVLVMGVLGGAAVVALAFINAGWQFLMLFALMGLLGMGRAGDFYVQVPLSKWFVRKRGRALSYAFLGTLAGITVFSFVSQWLIDVIGWRKAWVVFGVGGGLILVALTPLLGRQPEDYGLAPDGESPGGGPGGARRAAVAEASWTRKEAMRTPAFWLMAMGFGLFTFATSTMNLYRTPFFMEQGLQPRLVAVAISSEVGIGVVIAFAGGMVLDRFGARYVILMGFAAMFCAALVSRGTDTPAELFLSTNLFAVGASVSAISQGFMWAGAFGRAHIGDIRGFTTPLTMTFSAVAYPLAGRIRDVTGSFEQAFLVAMVATMLAAVLITLAKPPRKTPGQKGAP